MPSARVVEAFDVVEDIGTGLIADAVDLPGRASVFSEEKKLSIADLAMVARTSGVPMARFQTFPARLIEQVMPLSANRR